jgi:hypothetical protein
VADDPAKKIMAGKLKRIKSQQILDDDQKTRYIVKSRIIYRR